MNVFTAKRLFSYDPLTGILTWRVDNGKSVRAGDRAGCLDVSTGYRKVRYRGAAYPEHRISWMVFYGEDAPEQIDHINRIRDDNRISNLRAATSTENSFNKSVCSNNSSGVAGVYLSAEHGKWKAQISVRGKRHFLGLHDTLGAAKAARQDAEVAHFGAFRPTNQNERYAVAA